MIRDTFWRVFTRLPVFFSAFAILLSASFVYALEFIVDNSDTVACIVQPTNSWYTSNWGKPYGADKYYTTKGDGSKTVTWTAKLASGRYNVRAWVNSAPYASDAHYQIVHSRGTTAATRSQNLMEGDWPIDLGTYDFSTAGIVILSDLWAGAEQYVIADAVKFTEVSTTEVSWNTSSPQDALSIATSQDKPIMMFFCTAKSLDCQKMESITFPDSTLAKWAEKFVTVMVKAENNPEPLRMYNVFRTPTVIILDNRGKVMSRIEGFISANDLVKELNTQLSRVVPINQ